MPSENQRDTAANGLSSWFGALPGRLITAWVKLVPEQRLAAAAAMFLFITMFFPWYSKTNTFIVHGQTKPAEVSLTAFQSFSLVEAAVLVVATAVLYLLFARAENRQFHLPGGDGLIISLAGGWAGILIFYRLLDKPGTTGTATLTSTVGVRWGIFFALLTAIGLTFAGRRVHSLERPGPPLLKTESRIPLDEQATFREPAPQSQPAPERPAYPPPPSSAKPKRVAPRRKDGGEQLSFEDQPR